LPIFSILRRGITSDIHFTSFPELKDTFRIFLDQTGARKKQTTVSAFFNDNHAALFVIILFIYIPYKTYSQCTVLPFQKMILDLAAQYVKPENRVYPLQ